MNDNVICFDANSKIDSYEIIENSDNLIDVYDLTFNTTDQNIRSSSYFIKNWIGKIYRPRKKFYNRA